MELPDGRQRLRGGGVYVFRTHVDEERWERLVESAAELNSTIERAGMLDDGTERIRVSGPLAEALWRDKPFEQEEG